MKRTWAWVLSLALVGTGVVATAHDGGDDGEHEGHHRGRGDTKTRSDFALLKGPGGDVSVQCGAIRGGDEEDGFRPAAFTMYITMTNTAPVGAVRVLYADGDFVDYPIPTNTTVNITLAAGGTVGTDDIITVTSSGGSILIGQASMITTGGRPHPALPKQDGRSFCTTLP